MNRARAFLAVVTKDKRIYAIGGQGRGSRPKSSCEVYDSVSGEWSPIATLPQYALLASACNYRNTIYVSGKELLLPGSSFAYFYVQLHPAITDLKGPSIIVHYRRISVIAIKRNKEKFSQGIEKLHLF